MECVKRWTASLNTISQRCGQVTEFYSRSLLFRGMGREGGHAGIALWGWWLHLCLLLLKLYKKKRTFRRRESLNKHLPSFGFNGRGTSHHCVNFLDPVSVFLLTKTHTFFCFLTLNRLKRWNWNGCIRRQKFWKTVELKLDAFVRGSL